MSPQALLAILAGLRADDPAGARAGFGASIALWCVAALCVLAGFGFVCLFAFAALAEWLGIIPAAALCAVFLLGGAVACVLVARARARTAARRAAAATDTRARAVLDEFLADAAPRPLDLVVASLVGGLVLGASPALRRHLATLLSNGSAHTQRRT
ncbi:MAG: hypothetical protein RLW62_11285 [Gammaproteobacteria bacterium]